MDQSSKVNPSFRPGDSSETKDESRQVDPRRGLPSVDRLAREMTRHAPDLPDWSLREAARQAVAEARERISRGEALRSISPLGLFTWPRPWTGPVPPG